MTAALSSAPPRRILLAIDLRSRSDRASDRAVQLAAQWQAALHVVHVLPQADDGWPMAPLATCDGPTPSAAVPAERQLRRDFGETAVVHVGEGDPATAILAVAVEQQCELIVLGASDAPPAGRLGRVAEALLRRSPASLLVVKQRARAAYGKLLVGTDFTAESRHGLLAAAEWFPAARLALLHVLDIPYRSLWLDAGHGEELARMEHATMQAFVAATPLDGHRLAKTWVEHGHPEFVLHDCALEQEMDLVVISAFRRGLAFHLLVGGTARRVVPAAPCDVLLVRAPS